MTKDGLKIQDLGARSCEVKSQNMTCGHAMLTKQIV